MANHCNALPRQRFFDDLASWVDMAPELMSGGAGAGLNELKRRLSAVMQMSSFDRMFAEYDEDGNGQLELEEFTAVVREELAMATHKLSDDDVARLFHRVDADGSGSIEADELREFIKAGEIQKRMRLFSFKADWPSLFRDFSTHSGGGLRLPEFVCAVRKQALSVARGAGSSVSDEQLLEVFERACGTWPDGGGGGLLTCEQIMGWLAQEERIDRDAATQEADGEWDVLERVADALRVASYRTDWDVLFAKFDSDGSGDIDFTEFLRAIRMSMKIPEDQISDLELQELFSCIDEDGGGDINAEEFREFLWLDNLKRQLRHASEGAFPLLLTFCYRCTLAPLNRRHRRRRCC